VAVVAVGGYGRGELAPASDVDLAILHEGAAEEEGAAAATERILYPLWDAGLPVGHAVRTVDECLRLAAERVEEATSLLDARSLAGDRALAELLGERLLDTLRAEGEGFPARLADAVAERHERYGSASSMLEPDLKEGAGGLRDVHAIRWVARIAGQADPVTGGLLRAREAERLEEAEEFLVRLRSALHLETRRRGNRLYKELQPELARAFGFEETAGLRAPEVLMRTLFEHARQVEHLLGIVLRRYRRGDGDVEVAEPQDPERVMEAFARMAETGAPLSPSALDAVEAAAPEEPRWTEGTLPAFLRILRSVEGGGGALEAMDRAGLLVRYLPEWRAIRCRPQRDPYHRFTVDVHLVRTVTGVARLLAGEHDDDPIAPAAVAQVSDPDALLLGALLHDIGKTGEGSHVPTGVRVAASALDRMGVEGPMREVVLFLVREHLLLSDTATRRDLGDENLVLDVASRVRDQDRLAMLYLLTAADAKATGPHAWTPWRRALIRELVGKAQRVLDRGEMDADRVTALASRLEAVAVLAREEGTEPDAELLDRLPRAYLLAVLPETAARHLRLIAAPLGATEVRTEARPGVQPETYELTVVAADRPGLLAAIAGALAVHGLNILSAQAFTTEDGVALDVFVVEGAFEREVDEARWRRVRADLRRALQGRVSLQHLVAEKRRHYPQPAPIPTEVTVDNEASDFSTVVEVSTADRIGLLFDLARGFQDLELDVHLAKVATYGQRVVDAFYVRDLVGRKVEDPDRIREIERALTHRLTG
jgi:[protein-PII] uridylyltransferase